jgi:hypothetical protein
VTIQDAPEELKRPVAALDRLTSIAQGICARHAENRGFRQWFYPDESEVDTIVAEGRRHTLSRRGASSVRRRWAST